MNQLNVAQSVLTDMPLLALLADNKGYSRKRTLSEEDVQSIIFGHRGLAPVTKAKILPTAVAPLHYHINDDLIGVGSPREKFNRNVQAIQTLLKIESEDRLATVSEQATLSLYIGWGGLSQAFDPNNAKWKKEYVTLKRIMATADYQSARDSVLTSFYTPPVVIDAIYNGLVKMGFKQGNLLEPALGIGHFFGKLPGALSDFKLYGAELDALSGRIARQLYQDANIFVGGFESSPFPETFFDVAVSNVPFSQYKIYDPDVSRNNFLVHDYFFIKTLDKLRPGGVMAFITSKGTMDKKDNSVRRFISQRAELLGAVRLPNTLFKDNAGTVVTSDLIFLKKRDRLASTTESWVNLSVDQNGLALNQHYVDHPDMLIGQMVEISTQYGPDTACITPKGYSSLKVDLNRLISSFSGDCCPTVYESTEEDCVYTGLPADPTIHNFAYGLVNDQVYFRENSSMFPIDKPTRTIERIKGLVQLRETVRDLLRFQLEDADDAIILSQQLLLNQQYDLYVRHYDRINSVGNQRAFDRDDAYWLLCSLEHIDEKGKFIGKADIFSKRTIARNRPVEHVDTAQEALVLSIGEKGDIDFDYMEQLTNCGRDELTENLYGSIFKNPATLKWEMADAYLSGNIREKLELAESMVDTHPEYAINVDSLAQVLPEPLDASEIEVRLGSTWVDPSIIRDFVRDVFQPPADLIANGTIDVFYSMVSGAWSIKGAQADSSTNVFTNTTYGTIRVNGYRILEASLNLKDIRIYDTVYVEGNAQRILNSTETVIAQQKQDALKDRFRSWVFEDATRRGRLVAVYNERFNSNRNREFDGSNLVLHGISPDIDLREYQLNAVARALYGGGNTLLAHVVGAGKTYEMTAIAMESIFLGLAHKTLFVVPNHIIGQWSREFLQLYPSAKLLIARKKDFKKSNRKTFCSRIATGNYDAVIIGHSQFERIPLSNERQENYIREEIESIIDGIQQLKEDDGEYLSIKELVRVKKSLEAKLVKLLDSPKDDVVCFEELGIDRIFVDESHNYKNLFLHTKMRNVAGLSTTESQKASDLFYKCRYLNQVTDNRGVVFATGTPISNSLTELYTNMRYLAFDRLKELGLEHFDAWASTFAEQVTAIELAPEGTKYRLRTRLSRFFNLPELMKLFKNFTDVCTADQLNLPIPEAEMINITLTPSKEQKMLLADLVDRAESVRNNCVDASIDNMLKITTDGRKLALDQRLLDNSLDESETSKVSACAEQVHKAWLASSSVLGTQLVFCDLSVPKKDGSFNVYDVLKSHLIALGIPELEVAFIHDANTDVRKETLFANVRCGTVRVLIGSTGKMGSGTNIQNLLVALHHLDVPWRPSDLAQQEGRILRQGNLNKKVQIFRYITSETFDAYSWQIIENKQKFIGQIMTSKSPSRSSEDIDEQSLSFAEIKALATGNPLIKEKMDNDIKVAKLKLIKANYDRQRFHLEDQVFTRFPNYIMAQRERITKANSDATLYDQHVADPFSIALDGLVYTDKAEAEQGLLDLLPILKGQPFYKEFFIGQYRGFDLKMSRSNYSHIKLTLNNELSYETELNRTEFNNLDTLDCALMGIENLVSECDSLVKTTQDRLKNAQAELLKPFSQEDELHKTLLRLSELNAILSVSDRVVLESDTEDIAA